VRAHDPVRIEFADHLDQRLGVEFIEEEPAFLVLPRLVELVVHPAEYLRHAVHQVDVSLAVEPPEQRIREVEHVFVAYLISDAFFFERFL